MNEKTCSTYASSTSVGVRRARRRRRRRKRVFRIMSRISPSPASPLSGSASARTILMPLYCGGLCDAVICAPPSQALAGDGEIQHVGRHHPVVDDVGALRERARR